LIGYLEGKLILPERLARSKKQQQIGPVVLVLTLSQSLLFAFF